MYTEAMIRTGAARSAAAEKRHPFLVGSYKALSKPVVATGDRPSLQLDKMRLV